MTYRVEQQGAQFVVVNGAGKVVSTPRWTRGEANEVAELYRADDEREAAEERTCAQAAAPV